ncbi:MAG: hypothetical protein QME51_02760 [Planctomycetota bacterium]|nr:hypothetical protein [Planctomycetota bacterium]MDI6787275.1 hypothetical protein [Planctomycetota bacterium]
MSIFQKYNILIDRLRKYVKVNFNMFTILSIILSLLLSGCVSSTPAPRIDKSIIKEQRLIDDNFKTICNLMLKGKISTVYDKYFSGSLKNLQSYDEFVKGYNENKKSWDLLFKGAILKQISPEEKLASAIVVWGTGETSLIEFFKEDKIWKINFLRGPAVVFERGLQSQ